MLTKNAGSSVREPSVDALPVGYLTYFLGTEEYAIDILKVQEIRTYEAPITIANAPAFLKGVISLRGTVVPIVDLRTVFGIGRTDYTPFTVVIIVAVAKRVVGIVVDGVSDVTMLRDRDICPTTGFSAEIDDSHIRGLSCIDQRRLVVIDIESLIVSIATRSSKTSVKQQ